MMPFGSAAAGGCCPRCGCPTGTASGFTGPSMMPGTFAPPSAFPGMIGPGMMNPGMMAPGMFGPGLMAPWVAPNAFNWWGATPTQLGWGLGGGRRWGGSYTPQFMVSGLPTDNEIVEMIYDAIDEDPLIPYDAPIDVNSDAGTVTLTGDVMSKEIKHAAGDDAWFIPGVIDVRNDLTVTGRHHEARQAPTRAARASRGQTASS